MDHGDERDELGREFLETPLEFVSGIWFGLVWCISESGDAGEFELPGEAVFALDNGACIVEEEESVDPEEQFEFLLFFGAVDRFLLEQFVVLLNEEAEEGCVVGFECILERIGDHDTKRVINEELPKDFVLLGRVPGEFKVGC